MANTLIFISGFMGAGKSTVGRSLAQKLGWDFIDLDERVLSFQNEFLVGPTRGDISDSSKPAYLSLREIFEERGESYFRDLESATLATVCQNSRKVIALGGGTVVRPANRELIAAAGVLIYLRFPVAVLFARLTDQSAANLQLKTAAPLAGKCRAISERPLLRDLRGAELLARIEELLEERRAAYEDADFCCDLNGQTPGEIVDILWGLCNSDRSMGLFNHLSTKSLANPAL